MTRKELKKFNNPGELIQSWLREHLLSQSLLARYMRRPEKTISKIMSGKASVTAQTAIELQNVTSIKATYWLELQNKVDLKKFSPIDR